MVWGVEKEGSNTGRREYRKRELDFVGVHFRVKPGYRNYQESMRLTLVRVSNK